MNEEHELDWLDERLRAEIPYIDDEGFSARVVAKLPVRRQRRLLRAAIILSLTTLSALFAFYVSDHGRFLCASMLRLSSLSITVLLLLALSCGILLTVASLAAALQRSERL
jgi:hypothetical protein